MAPDANKPGPMRPAPDYQDYVDRYQQNPNSISEREAYERYQAVAPQLPPRDYHQAAHDTFAQMSPEQRRHFAQELSQRAQQEGYPPPFPDVNQNGVDDRLEDPRYLAQATSQMQQQQPGLLGQLFGGGGGQPNAGGMLSNPWAKGALGGIAAYGAARLLGGGGLFGGGGHGGGLFGGGEHGGGFFGGGHGGGHDEHDD